MLEAEEIYEEEEAEEKENDEEADEEEEDEMDDRKDADETEEEGEGEDVEADDGEAAAKRQGEAAVLRPAAHSARQHGLPSCFCTALLAACPAGIGWLPASSALIGGAGAGFNDFP